MLLLNKILFYVTCIFLLIMQANLWFPPPISTCSSKCWLLGMSFAETSLYNLILIILSVIAGLPYQHPVSMFPCCLQMSYIIVDLMTWWGMRGIINDFRKKKLKLPPIAYFSMYRGSISHLPTGYMWSPHVVPKPSGMDKGAGYSH